tara:strand:+ start:62 stop:427 length:366 start_codon:yes stop_codon:yes gene_type:complete
MDYTEIANQFEQDDNLEGLETLFNKNIIPIKVLLLNGTYETRWTDVSNVFKEYYEDLNSVQQDYIRQLNPKKEYWKVIFEHDLNVYEYDLKTCKNDWFKEFITKPIKSEYQQYYSYKKASY